MKKSSALFILLLLIASSQLQAATAITVQALTETWGTIASGASAVDTVNGNSIKNLSENVMIYARNTGTSGSAVITIAPANTSINIPGYGVITKASQAVTLGANQDALVGPFPAALWNDGNGNLQLTYTGSASNVFLTAFSSSKLAKVP